MAAHDYYDHPDYRALLQSVLVNPSDDLPRLVLADWIEERGDRDRANFVRWQCEAASTGRKCLKDGVDNFTRPDKYRRMWRQGCRCRHCTLRRRAEELQNHRMHRTLSRYSGHANRQRFRSTDGLYVTVYPFGSGGWVRGFAGEWSVDTLFARHGLANVFRTEPVQTVWLTGRPYYSRQFRVEIEQPDGQGGGWQAYFYRPDEADYFFLCSWESREGLADLLPLAILEVIWQHFYHPDGEVIAYS